MTKLFCGFAILFSGALIATNTFAQIVSVPYGPVCQGFLDKTKSGNKPAAFALSEDGKRCGYSFGKNAANTAEASAKALASCKTQGGVGCRITFSK